MPRTWPSIRLNRLAQDALMSFRMRAVYPVGYLFQPLEGLLMASASAVKTHPGCCTADFAADENFSSTPARRSDIRTSRDRSLHRRTRQPMRHLQLGEDGARGVLPVGRRVRLGSFSSFRARSRHDRFTPMNGHIQR